jgi:NAD(P)-dependent dehydrogenase (short-subunit alcohol dehydrogenase family)
MVEGIRMRLLLHNKVAIITGAASGIGRACVGRFLQEGARVIATDINAEALAELAGKADASPDELVTITGDVSKREDSRAIVARAMNQYGRLDVLVNSAGITTRNVRAEADFEERWDEVMRVNVKGTLLMSHAAVEAMRHTGSGAIVNLASVMGNVGYPTFLPFSDGFNAYPQSKGAVAQMTRDMGVRLAAEGIRVNAVAPGFIYTAITENVTKTPELHTRMKELHPIQRMGQAEEVANVIAFLASEEASFVVGAVWAVDGGYTAQ